MEFPVLFKNKKEIRYFTYNDYIIESEEDSKEYEFWLQKKDYGYKMFMNCFIKEDIENENQLFNHIMNNINQLIELYEEDLKNIGRY